MLEITYNDGIIQAMLKRIKEVAGNTEPAMEGIGNVVMEIAKRSFDNSASPDGTPWAANSEATILQYLEKTGGNYKKDGTLSKKGQTRAINKRPLIGQSRDLQRQFSYVATADSVTISNSMVYAAMQQFGGTTQQFPHLWGNIPARPFMPIATDGSMMQQAEAEIVQVMQDYLDDIISG